MKQSIKLGLILPLAFFLILPLSQVSAQTATDSKCTAIKDSDRRNLCLATPREEQKKEFGYQKKDHRPYFCTLIKSKDLQKLCLAIVGSNKNFCALIIDKNIEAECLASF